MFYGAVGSEGMSGLDHVTRPVQSCIIALYVRSAHRLLDLDEKVCEYREANENSFEQNGLEGDKNVRTCSYGHL